MRTADLGLLLDVDGPIASPVSRTIAIRSIVTDLVTLAGAGVPIAFITGRSETFLRHQVVAPLLAAGMPETAAVFGVCEKGGVFFPIGASGIGEVTVDTAVALPEEYFSALRRLVAADFADTMFFDDTKHVMISIEQRTDVPHERYVAAQPAMNEAAFALLVRQGLGARLGEREVPDARGRVDFRIDATIISTDVESVTLDKGPVDGERALTSSPRGGRCRRCGGRLGTRGATTLMADHLFSAGFEVAHVDVRPADGILPVRTRWWWRAN